MSAILVRPVTGVADGMNLNALRAAATVVTARKPQPMRYLNNLCRINAPTIDDASFQNRI